MLPRRAVVPLLLLAAGSFFSLSPAVAGGQAIAEAQACASNPCAAPGVAVAGRQPEPWLGPTGGVAATVSVAGVEPAVPLASAVAASTVRPGPLAEIFGASVAVRSLEQGLAPYLTVAAARSGGLLQPVAVAAGSADGTPRPEFRLGEDMIVMPVKSATERVPVVLPGGVWINYWTGAQAMGGATVAVEVAGDSYPMWARGGSVIPRRTGGYGGTSFLERRLKDDATNCGATCLYEVMPAFNDNTALTQKDADGRTLTRGATSLRISGAATRAIVRWRFQRVKDVFLNGQKIPVQTSPDGYYASFDHTADSTVEWTVLSYMPRSY